MLIDKRVHLFVYIDRDMSLGRSYIQNNRDEYEKLSDNEYLSLLPLSKCTRETINGKHLKVIISTIVYLKIRKALFSTGISMSKLFGRVSSFYVHKKIGLLRNSREGQQADEGDIQDCRNQDSVIVGSKRDCRELSLEA